MNYDQFINDKKYREDASGFTVDQVSPALFDFQREIVRWSIRRGRAAIFADTGLGKTAMQCEWARHIHEHTSGYVLILAPLCVAKQTVQEAGKFGIDVRYVREQAHVNKPGIWITNYEMLDSFDMRAFKGVVLDESSILKAYDGKTRSRLIDACGRIPYRLSCTATPSPNDYMELGNQSEFLGIMRQTEMLATFFTHDGSDTSKWRLKGHGKTRFWEWLSTWSVCIRRPSDLGFSDEGFDLPALTIHEHQVTTDQILEGQLFAKPAETLSEQRQAQRDSLRSRVAEIAKKVNASNDRWIIWCHLNAESDALEEAIPDATAITGSDSIAQKESIMDAFTSGNLRVLVTKPSIAGYGMNWQHCHQMAFVGLSHSFEQYYQAVRRCYRFGQKHPVDVHLVCADTEGAIKVNLQRKQKQSDEMSQQMVEHMKELTKKAIHGAQVERAEYLEDKADGEGWELYLGDCVQVAGKIPDAVLDYSIFSPPFASLYTYSNSDYDMGNSRSDEEFYQHFRFLIHEMFRAFKPGRIASVHCMNLPTSKQNHGYIGLRDFRGEIIRLFVAEGWIFHSEVCIWKDPVVAMQRTKALGLLWKQLKKDSAMSRQGIPDYLVSFRKPGDNPNPIDHRPDDFPVTKWQKYASPVWMDINQSNTLQFRSARENDDERHICPLQLDVIERGIELWSRPGDLVYSPFAGIGSEGYMALKLGRRFIGSELKSSYWNLACKNLQASVHEQGGLFAA